MKKSSIKRIKQKGQPEKVVSVKILDMDKKDEDFG